MSPTRFYHLFATSQECPSLPSAMQSVPVTVRSGPGSDQAQRATTAAVQPPCDTGAVHCLFVNTSEGQEVGNNRAFYPVRARDPGQGRRFKEGGWLFNFDAQGSFAVGILISDTLEPHRSRTAPDK